MDSELSNKILEQVKADYNLIAKDYARTRARIPQDLKDIVEKYAIKSGRILDSGCGNGRLFELLGSKPGVEYAGIDASGELVKIAKQNYLDGNFITADALALPFSDNYFDQIFSMSVLHHFPGATREKYLQECFRILKPGKKIILRVWNMWENGLAKELLIKFSIGKIMGQNKMDWLDIFYPWKDGSGGVLAQRYLHCFTESRLRSLFARTGFIVEESWTERKGVQSNIYVIARKP